MVVKQSPNRYSGGECPAAKECGEKVSRNVNLHLSSIDVGPPDLFSEANKRQMEDVEHLDLLCMQ
jgi:hypothetical protein